MTSSTGTWTCAYCGLDNVGARSTCERCNTIWTWGQAPEVEAAGPSDPAPTSETRQPRRRRRWIWPVVLLVVVTLPGFGRVLAEKDAEERLDRYLAGDLVHDYYSAEGGFRADFPGLPERAEEIIDVEGQSLPMTTFSAGTDLLDFGVGVYDVDASLFDFEAGANGGALAVDGRLVWAEHADLDGHRALDFLVEGDGFVLRGMFIEGGDRVYVVWAVGEDDMEEPFRRFLDSFKMDAGPLA